MMCVVHTSARTRFREHRESKETHDRATLVLVVEDHVREHMLAPAGGAPQGSWPGWVVVGGATGSVNICKISNANPKTLGTPQRVCGNGGGGGEHYKCTQK
jgi:hypothetical protein